MRKTIIWLALVLVLAPVAARAASNPTPSQLAEKDCRALRATMGGVAFAQAFGGTSAAFGACVAKLARGEQANVRSANSLCQAEQADPTFSLTHGGKTFDEFYGTGPLKRNAFGNCVSLKARNSSAAARHGLNPAKSCVALRESMTPALFKQSFGTNASHGNAFGKCASIVARAQSGDLVGSAQACLTEANDANFALTHDGKSFQQYYGTNKDQSDAFGNCVLQKLKASTAKNVQALKNAARTCKAMRRSDPAAFRGRYGTKPSAFAKCVSAHAKLK
jgi:hypothetical protein